MDCLDLRALEIFRMVAVEGSITKAARRLHRVQSNVSTRIKQLEEHLNKRLFRRQKRGLTLTPDGEVLLTYADRLLQLSTEARAALNEDRPTGLLRIGTMESTAASRLPEILSRYHHRHPDVEIDLVTDTAGGLLNRLNHFEVDAVFVAEPVEFTALRTQPVFEESLVLVAPHSFPPIEDQSQISGKTVIAFEQGCAYRRYLEDWLLGAGIVPGGIISMGSYLGILACVSAGTGYAVVPQSVLDTVSTKGRIRKYPLPGSLAHIKTLLTWRSDYTSANLDALKALLPAI